MAGDWIKFELATLEKPEVWLLAQELGIEPDAVIGKLLRVWSWFDQHSANGHAPSVTKTLLNAKTGVTDFCEKMQKVGWLEENDDFISLPNFDRHNGENSKKRAQNRKRKQNQRDRNSGHADVTQEGAEMSRSERDENVTREEKRREEVNNISDSNESPSADADSSDNSKPPKKPTRQKFTWPFQPDELSQAWHETMPANVPRLTSWSDTRTKHLKARINTNPTRQNVENWRTLFKAIAASPNHCGENSNGWTIALDWLIKSEDNLLKTFEQVTRN